MVVCRVDSPFLAFVGFFSMSLQTNSNSFFESFKELFDYDPALVLILFLAIIFLSISLTVYAWRSIKSKRRARKLAQKGDKTTDHCKQENEQEQEQVVEMTRNNSIDTSPSIVESILLPSSNDRVIHLTSCYDRADHCIHPNFKH